LILRKISKIGATRCQILRLKCIKFDFRWGSAPDSAGGAYSAAPDSLAVFKGPTSKGREGKGGREGKEKRGKGRGEEGVRRSPISCWHRAPRRVNPALNLVSLALASESINVKSVKTV